MAISAMVISYRHRATFVPISFPKVLLRSLGVIVVLLGLVSAAATAWSDLTDFDTLIVEEDGTLPGWNGLEFATELHITSDEAMVSVGEKALRVTLEATADGNKRAMVVFTPSEDRRDWRSVKGVMVDVYNPHDVDMRIGFALQTGEAYVWQELAPVTLRPGWTKDISFSFADADWKSSATGWAYTSLPVGTDDLRGVNFLVVAPTEGTFYFTLDHIRVDE